MFALAGTAFAQAPPASTPKPPAAEPFEITDNSFLVEEAFNQEAGIFQNICGAVFANGNWVADSRRNGRFSRRRTSCRSRCRD